MNTSTRGLIVLIVLIVVLGFFCGALPFVILPQQNIGVGLPVIFLPGEVLQPDWLGEGFDLTNTMVGTLLADAVILILLVALYITGGIRAIPGRLQALFELFVEYMYNFAKSIAGARAARLFPLVMSIFVFLLVANWLELFPGVDSVGLLHCAEPPFKGYPINVEEGQEISGLVTLRVDRPLDGGTAATLADFCACEAQHVGHIPEKDVPGMFTADEEGELTVPVSYTEACAELGITVEHHEEDAEHSEDATHDEEAEGEGADHSEDTASEGEGDTVEAVEPNPNIFVVTPFVRAAATDLSLTVGLAIVSVIAIQVFGVWSLGLGYFQKFVNLRALGNLGKNPLGLIDFGVGIIEIVSEFSKILSLAFRLFGNIFAGQVLLFVMAFLVATLLPAVFYALELFVGLMQAFVFAVLTLIFSAQAMESHHGDDEHH